MTEDIQCPDNFTLSGIFRAAEKTVGFVSTKPTVSTCEIVGFLSQRSANGTLHSMLISAISLY